MYISGATFTFIGGIALLANASDNLGWSSFIFAGILLRLFNDQPEVPRRTSGR
jgi:hypothetical protein